MQIIDVHRNSPVELRFVIVDGQRVTTRMIFVKDTAPALEVAGAIADNINLYFENKDAGFPHDYNTEEHIAGILADAARYGCD